MSSPVTPGLSQAALGVSRTDIEHMRVSAPGVLNDVFFKKVQILDQVTMEKFIFSVYYLYKQSFCFQVVYF